MARALRGGGELRLGGRVAAVGPKCARRSNRFTLKAAAALLDVDPRKGETGPPEIATMTALRAAPAGKLDTRRRGAECLKPTCEGQEDGVQFCGSKNCPKCGGAVFRSWRCAT